MFGYVYLTTNLINNKIYIGQHKFSEKRLDEKYLGSGKILLQAIQKDGIENFKCEVLCFCESQDELNAKEIFYIKQYKSQERNIGYNIVDGGNHKSRKGAKFVHKGTTLKLVAAEDIEYYLEQGFELGRGAANPDVVAKIALANRGKKRSEETKQKLSAAQKGKKASYETRQKLSEAHKGKKSSCKDTKFMQSPDGISHRIHIDKVDYFLSLGWQLKCRGWSTPKDLRTSKAKGYIGITDGKIQKYIHPDKFAEYEALGFYKGKLKK